MVLQHRVQALPQRGINLAPSHPEVLADARRVLENVPAEAANTIPFWMADIAAAHAMMDRDRAFPDALKDAWRATATGAKPVFGWAGGARSAGADFLLGIGDCHILGAQVQNYQILSSWTPNGPCNVWKENTVIGQVPPGQKKWLDGLRIQVLNLTSWYCWATVIGQYFRSRGKLKMGAWNGQWQLPTYFGLQAPAPKGLSVSAVFDYNYLVPAALMEVTYEVTTDTTEPREIETIIRTATGDVVTSHKATLQGATDYRVFTAFPGLFKSGIIEINPTMMPRGCTLTSITVMRPPLA